MIVVCVLGLLLATPILTQEGYYWRSYKGDLPKDAFPAGLGPEKEPVYIGRTLHPSLFVLPGTISPREKEMSYEYGNREHRTKQDVMIFCTKQPRHFKWIEAKLNQPVEDVIPKNYEMIQAGSDRNQTVYVGRGKVERKALVGKFLVLDDNLSVLWFGYNYTSQVYSAYEILTYVVKQKS